MKIRTIAVIMSILWAVFCSAQISTEVGLNSRISPTLKAAIEVPLSQFNIELGTMISADNFRPVTGLQAGYSFIVDRFNQELRLSIGPYYHYGLLPLDKDVREQKFLFGGSLRFKWDVNIFMSGEWNGETGKIGIGYLFGKK